jgi:FtsH-binding integral membrane protein
MIIERVDRSGHVLDSYAFEEDVVAIGRAYNNQLVVPDPYVDARHARLSFDEDSQKFRIFDLGSENGIRVVGRGHARLEQPGGIPLESGDIILIGKTRYRILSRSHEVPAVLRLSSLDALYSLTGTWWIAVFALLAMFGLEAYVAYLVTPYSEHLYKDLVEALYVLIAAVIYGLLWVTIARTQKHEGRFLLHCNMFILAYVVSHLFTLSAPIIDFNFRALSMGGYLFKVLTCLGLFIVVYVSCYQSTGLKVGKRIMVSLFVPAIAILGYVVSGLNQPEFDYSPRYNMSVVAERWQWLDSEDSSIFTESVGEALYQPATEEARERLPE